MIIRRLLRYVFIFVCVILIFMGISLYKVPTKIKVFEQENDDSYISKSVKTQNLELVVELPSVVNGNEIEYKAILKYLGEDEIELFSGEPVIRHFLIPDPYEIPRAYNDIGKITKLRKGDEIVIRKKVDIPKKGDYNLIIHTTTLSIDDIFLSVE